MVGYLGTDKVEQHICLVHTLLLLRTWELN